MEESTGTGENRFTQWGISDSVMRQNNDKIKEVSQKDCNRE